MIWSENTSYPITGTVGLWVSGPRAGSSCMLRYSVDIGDRVRIVCRLIYTAEKNDREGLQPLIIIGVLNFISSHVTNESIRQNMRLYRTRR